MVCLDLRYYLALSRSGPVTAFYPPTTTVPRAGARSTPHARAGDRGHGLR